MGLIDVAPPDLKIGESASCSLNDETYEPAEVWVFSSGPHLIHDLSKF